MTGKRSKVVPLPAGGDPANVKPLQARLQAESDRTGLDPRVVERDYVMSWVLAGIASVRSLKETLVLNDGSALRKSYFRGYRFTEEMDFTAVGAVPTGPALDEAIMDATSNVVRMLAPYTPAQIHCAPSARRASREEKKAFEITTRFPWQKQAPPVVARITMDEVLLTPCASRLVQHDYGETIKSQVLVCSLDEIVAEKLRAILAHGASGKSEAVDRRILDYYDLWRVLEAFGGRLDVPDFPALLREKCRSRSLSFQGPESFFPEPLLAQVQTGWEKALESLMTEVPLYQTIVTQLSAHVSALLASPRIQKVSAAESPSGESPTP